MTLQIRLLGGFSLEYEGKQVYDVHRTRFQSLLAYLLLHGSTPLQRRQIAFTFWPDSSEEQARNNLRKNFHDLRQALPDWKQFLHQDTHTIHWRVDAPYSLDVASFDEAIRQAATHRRQNRLVERSFLKEAVDLYQGDLLPGCYDDWIEPERERMRQLYYQTLERLIKLAEDAEDYAGAIAYANQLLRTDPLRESIYRRLIRFHALQGDRASALRVYHDCVSHLERELGVEPGPEIQHAYQRVLGADVPERLQPQERRSAGFTPLVGREREWWMLLDAWDTAAKGNLHLCLIRGEAGIGKSRLAQELLAWVAEHGFTSAQTRAYERAGALAYTPLIDWLETPALQAAIQRLDEQRLCEISRLLPNLLVERPDVPPPEPIREGWQRQKLLEALTQAFLTCRQPLLLLLDDAQWCDADTFEWIQYLLHHSGPGKGRSEILLVCTARGEEMDVGHALLALSRAFQKAGQRTEIDLAPLNPEQTDQLRMQVHADALDPQQAANLFDYTGGNPLFIVEALASGSWEKEIERATSAHSFFSPGEVGTFPSKLYGLIQARLDQLTTSPRHLASVAAAIGRAFSFTLLHQASGLDENEAMLGLDLLWRRGIVREGADGRYDFSHDRIRDVAYAEISPVQRPLLHRRVAQALTANYAENLDSISGQLGLHYEQAGERSTAIDYYERAAEASASIFAQSEVITYTDRALALLAEEPSTDETVRRRIDILMRKERGIVFIYGETSVAREQLLESAYSLSHKIDDVTYRFRVLKQIRAYYGWRGDRARTSEISPEHLALAQASGDAEALSAAYWEMGELYFGQGKFADALEQLQVALTVGNSDFTGRHHALYSYGSLFLSAMLQAHIIWLLGYPDRSRQQAVEAAHSVDREGLILHQLVVASYFCIYLQYLGDLQALGAAIEKLKERCRILAHQDSMFEVGMMEGWYQVETESSPAGLEQITTCLRGMQARGSRVYHPYWLCLLAQAQRKLGQWTEALETLQEAYLLSEEQGDFHWLAEIHRLTGVMQQTLGYKDATVEASFNQALDIARQQGAKSLELRAAMSMVRFWQKLGKTPQAHELLSGIYGWFTEGFDTPDLQAARALLAELSSPSS